MVCLHLPSGSTTSLDGQSVSYARMTLDLSTLGNSFRPCSGGGAGNGNGNNNGNGNGNGSSNSGHRRLLQVEPASYVRITVLFGIVNDTVFQYGQGENITVKQGGLKFNIEQKGW